MESVSQDSDVQVVVDYAHTPAAMEAALEAMNLHKEGQLWCVFGCGGDRDAGKRPLMGEIAEPVATARQGGCLVETGDGGKVCTTEFHAHDGQYALTWRVEVTAS